MVNIVGSSSKRVDILKEKQVDSIAEALENCEITSGKGLNQCMSLKRTGDTRWGSHYGTLVSLITMFSSTIQVLEDDGSTSEQICEANTLLNSMQSFEFVFPLHLIKTILGITEELSKVLQKNDQDIVNAMTLVKYVKKDFK